MEGIETSALTDVQLKAVQDDLGITAAMTEATKGVTDAATAQAAAEAAQATADKGVPVDEVTAGNMFPATSNAVNTALIKNVNRIINSEGTGPTNNNADHTIIAGMYVCTPDMLGLPVAAYGVLAVYGHYTEVPSVMRQWIYQDFHTTSGEIYHRCSINGGSLTPDNWGPWDKYVKESDLAVSYAETSDTVVLPAGYKDLVTNPPAVSQGKIAILTGAIIKSSDPIFLIGIVPNENKIRVYNNTGAGITKPISFYWEIRSGSVGASPAVQSDQTE